MANKVTMYEAYRRANELILSLLTKSNWRSEIKDPLRRMRLSFQRIRILVQSLGNPHRGISFVHVGGTSGKGSVTHMVYEGLRAAGFSVGLHTNPYLTAPIEEIAINGRLVSAGEFAHLVNQLVPSLEKVYRKTSLGLPTYLEAKTALALLAFKEAGVEWAVIEVRSGGRFDSTNIITPDVSVVTNVSRDHLDRLGPTLTRVAWHKAGIIKPGVPVVVGVSQPRLRQVFLQEAKRKGSELQFVETGGLRDDYLVLNRKIAQVTLEVLAQRHPTIKLNKAEQALAAVRVPGRFELIKDRPPVILDAAHNPAKVRALTRMLNAHYPARPIRLVFGALASKEISKMVMALPATIDEVFITAPFIEERLVADLRVVKEAFQKRGVTRTRLHLDPHDAYEQALKQARAHRDAVVVVTGSLFLVGNIRERYWPESRILRLRRNI